MKHDSGREEWGDVGGGGGGGTVSRPQYESITCIYVANDDA